MRRVRVNVPFAGFGKLAQQDIQRVLENTSRPDDIDSYVSKVTLRCNSCGYQLNANEKKALIILALKGKKQGSDLFGIPSIKADCCPKCNFSDATYFT